MPDFVIAAACNAQAILDNNLARSPVLAEGLAPLLTEFGAPSASVAYNRLLDRADAPVVVLAHQDVYLPRGWQVVLAARLAEVAARDPDWALFGAFGVGLDDSHIGPVWSSSLGAIVGQVPIEPMPVQSYDELLIVVNKAAGPRFDEALPGWHLYGTDIVTSARAAGKGAWAGALPCIHNDRYHPAIGPDFAECYRHLQRKWADRLPLRSPITKISRSGLHLKRDMWHARSSAGFREGMAVGTDTAPEVFARRCGWMDLTACA
jgi:hypothetical protein